ncbi:MAG: hypothetical protein ABI977_09300 [Acidobacteriota bacterium]
MILAFASFYYSCVPRPGKVIETWETSNGAFKLRVTARIEKNGFPTGGYYSFQSAPLSSNTWQDITTFRHDDPIEIRKNQVGFINDQTAYFFMGWIYAVTTDKGQTWSVWDAKKDLPYWQCCNYELVREINLSPDGTGTMRLNPIPGRSGEVPELRTKDFGRHWEK